MNNLFHIADLIVKDIKGELKVSSQINLGSSFEILIPQDNIV